MLTVGLTFLIRAIVLVISSGWAFDTATPVPMSSGGSMAIMSGSSAATAAPTPAVFAQTIVTNSALLAISNVSSISDTLILLSEWLTNVPSAPADRTASASM